MGEKDITEKTLEAYNDVFADIVNVLMMRGKQIVQEDELEDDIARSHYKTKTKMRELERDVAKYWKNANIRIASLCMENQTDVDADMPFRVMAYDGVSYRAQLLQNEENQVITQEKNNTKKNRKQRFPVITLVLYFGYEKHWNKPLTLYDSMNIPNEIKPYVNDYKINLFEVAYLTDEQLNMLHSDFRIVADYFVQMRKNHNYIPKPEKIKHVHAVLEMMSALTKDRRFEDVCDEVAKGEDTTMCEVLDRIVEQGEARGEANGEKKMGELYTRLCNDGKQENYSRAIEDKEYREQLYREYCIE